MSSSTWYAADERVAATFAHSLQTACVCVNSASGTRSGPWYPHAPYSPPSPPPAQAEKKLKSFGFFSNKYEDAAEYFEKAGNSYKLAKAWTEAAECFGKLADCHIKCDSKHEAASSYVEAAKMAAKTKPQMSTELLQHAIGLYTDMGRLNMAARQLREVAEINEKQGLREEALAFFEQAADLFETDGSSSEATKCR